MTEDKLKRNNVKHATIRDGDDVWHIECRFDDGQKFPAVIIDKTIINAEFIAEDILTMLTGKRYRSFTKENFELKLKLDKLEKDHADYLKLLYQAKEIILKQMDIIKNLKQESDKEYIKYLINRLREEGSAYTNEIINLNSQAGILLSIISELKEALKFYANKKHIHKTGSGKSSFAGIFLTGNQGNEYLIECGDYAKTALEGK